jgi:hypothetical protein
MLPGVLKFIENNTSNTEEQLKWKPNTKSTIAFWLQMDVLVPN